MTAWFRDDMNLVRKHELTARTCAHAYSIHMGATVKNSSLIATPISFNKESEIYTTFVAISR